MPQSLSQIYLHLVFSTKHREPFLADRPLRDRTFAYLAGTCDNLACPAVVGGGVADHVHMLCRFGKTIPAADLLRDLKRDSSKWLKEQSSALGAFHWQIGYGAFSISPGHVAAVRQYVERQEEHHATVSFQDEFRRLCQRYGVNLDERYCWD